MNMRNTSLVVAALVLGLALGNVIGGFAAPSTDASPSTNGVVAACTGLGLKMGAAVRDAGGRMSDIVAKLTGLDAEDIQAKRQAGQSIADIAEDEGVKASTVVDESLKVRKELLDAKVKDETISQDQADEALDRMEARLTERVNSTATGGGCGMGGGRGGRGGGMGGGAGAGGCGGACTQSQAPVTQ